MARQRRARGARSVGVGVVLSFVCARASALFFGEVAFEPAVTYPTENVPEPVASGDIDGDGILDVVVANTAAGRVARGDSVTVLTGNGDGTFRHRGNFPVGALRPEGVALARLDGDGNLDIATSNFASSSVSLLFGTGTGSFSAPVVVPIDGGPRYVVARDFTGDGRTDLATANFLSSTVSVLRGDGRGAFEVISTVPVGSRPEVLQPCDLDGDGVLDLVTANASADTLSILRGDGGGGFTVAAPHFVELQPRYVLPLDLDGDGLDDLVVANNDSSTVTLERNRGGLVFERAATLSRTAPDFQLRSPVYLAAADMDHNGLKDLIVTWADTDALSIFPRAEAGGFAFEAPIVVQTGATPVGVLAADFEEDGDVDLLVTNALDDTVSVYLSYQMNQSVIVDNSDGQTEALGAWSPSEAPFHYGADSIFSKNGTRFRWTAELPNSGSYDVQVWWTSTLGRSTRAVYEVQHAFGSSSIVVDQTSGVGVWHSLGAYDFETLATVILTAPSDDRSVAADAVRFRPLVNLEQAPVRGIISVESSSRPRRFRLDDDTVLAFQGTIGSFDEREPEEWVGAVFAPVGEAEESVRIRELRLYEDSNRNGSLDEADLQLGDARRFESDIRVATFDGFSVPLPRGKPLDIFVVAELASPLVAAAADPAGARSPEALHESEAARPVLAVFGVAFLLAMAPRRARRRSRRRLQAWGVGLLCLLALGGLGLSSCGHSGRGSTGSPGEGAVVEEGLKIQLETLVTRGRATQLPSIVQGLPSTGWGF